MFFLTVPHDVGRKKITVKAVLAVTRESPRPHVTVENDSGDSPRPFLSVENDSGGSPLVFLTVENDSGGFPLVFLTVMRGR